MACCRSPARCIRSDPRRYSSRSTRQPLAVARDAAHGAGALWSLFSPASSICSSGRGTGDTSVPVAAETDAERPAASGAASDSDSEPGNQTHSTARHGFPNVDTSRAICFGTGCESSVEPPGVGHIVARKSASSQSPKSVPAPSASVGNDRRDTGRRFCGGARRRTLVTTPDHHFYACRTVSTFDPFPARRSTAARALLLNGFDDLRHCRGSSCTCTIGYMK
jgi:hypothetical protein